MRLSEHFQSSEFPGWSSATAVQRERLQVLVATVLEPIRRRWGPVVVTSWVRGSGAHATGGAVDFFTPDEPTMKEVWKWAATHLASDFGELIHEPPEPGQTTAHIHVTLWGIGGKGQALVERVTVADDGTVTRRYVFGFSALTLLMALALAFLLALATAEQIQTAAL